MDFLLTSASFWHTVLSSAARTEPHRETSGVVRVVMPRSVRAPIKKTTVTPPAPKTVPAPVVLPIAMPDPEPVVTLPDTPGERVVVIAPHPDDEILCCSSTLADRVESGAEVSIIFLTDGDARVEGDWTASRKYGSQRRAESSAAARALGIPQKNLYFFGFPDGHLDELLDRGQARSVYTGRRATPRSTAYPGATYTRGSLERILKKQLAALNPDELFVPSVSDSHPDHRAAAELVQSVITGTPTIRGYAVHGISGTADAEQDSEKLKLIRLFETQRHDGYHVQFLEKFASISERFERVVASR